MSVLLVVAAAVTTTTASAATPKPSGSSTPTKVVAPTPPQQPAPGQLGGAGPCKSGPVPQGFGGKGEYVWMFTPSGAGSPRTGGNCSDRARPVVFWGHGATAIIPLAYQKVIDNMVSNGYIVVFANQSILWDPQITYRQVLDGAKYAATSLDPWVGRRMDLNNIGIWGHSSGGGMVPFLAQQFGAMGWGRTSMWLSMNAPHYSFMVGTSGAIHLPSNARVQVVNFDRDDTADMGIGIEQYKAFDVPTSQKTHIVVRSEGAFVADHFSPNSWMLKDMPDNFIDYYGLYRNYQALGDCAHFGTNCNADLTYMGTWSDGHEAPRALISKNPVDVGPPGVAKTGDCDYYPTWQKFGVPHLCAK